jgi:hypothetical protein
MDPTIDAMLMVYAAALRRHSITSTTAATGVHGT